MLWWPLTLSPCIHLGSPPLQSMLLFVVGVIFEYRNLVISCSCLSHFNGFLCCEGQDHNCYHGLQSPAFFGHCLPPNSFSAPHPSFSLLQDVTMSCSFQPLGLCICHSFHWESASPHSLLHLSCSLFGSQHTCHVLKENSPESSLPIPHSSTQDWVYSATWHHRIILSHHCT